VLDVQLQHIDPQHGKLRYQLLQIVQRIYPAPADIEHEAAVFKNRPIDYLHRQERTILVCLTSYLLICQASIEQTLFGSRTEVKRVLFDGKHEALVVLRGICIQDRAEANEVRLILIAGKRDHIQSLDAECL